MASSWSAGSHPGTRRPDASARQPVRIVEAERSEDAALTAFHPRGVAPPLVIKARQVQQAVYQKVRMVRPQRLALLASFPSHYRGADHDVAFERFDRIGKAQHVGRVVLAA